MANKTFLSPIQLFNLTAVRHTRLHFGISGPEISDDIDKSPNYIGTMENEQTIGSYDDTVLADIAKCITDKIKNRPDNELEIKGKREYTIHDFYPTEILNDEKVVKKVDPIPPGSGASVTLNALIESSDFFKKARTLNEIVKKCNSIQDQNWSSSDFTQQLDRATKGKNKRLNIILKNGLNTYILAKKQKKD